MRNDYLDDTAFLKYFNELEFKEQYIRINSLDYETERIIDSLEGRATGGSINLDGNSSLRRTCSLEMTSLATNKSYTELDTIFSINKKITVDIMFKNTTQKEFPKYAHHEYIIFPQGVFVIESASLNKGQDGISISLSLKDKMALLNGDLGGIIDAPVIFSSYNDFTYTDKGLSLTKVTPTLYQIITELVNHFGGEQLGRIIIELDKKVKRLVSWNGGGEVYLTQDKNGKYYLDKTKKGSTLVATYKNGDSIGFTWEDFIWPDQQEGQELSCNPGESVCSVLDKIKEKLGDYEYFYDIDGNFVFRPIKSFSNTTAATDFLNHHQDNKTNAESFLSNVYAGKSVYTFDKSNIILSYTRDPQYKEIKNDFVILGYSGSDKDKKYPNLRYHLAIDSRPPLPKEASSFKYFKKEKTEKVSTGKEEKEIINDIVYRIPTPFNNTSEFPSVGDAGVIYQAGDDSYYIYIVDTETGVGKYKLISEKPVYNDGKFKDYREVLFWEGAKAGKYGVNSNIYYDELRANFPNIFDLENHGFIKNDNPQFFLDIIDSDTDLSKLSISAIGRRTKVQDAKDVNCIFEPDLNDMVYIIKGNQEDINYSLYKGTNYCEISEDIRKDMLQGAVLNSAVELAKSMLYQYTKYVDSVGLNLLPIYNLEPNNRVTINDPESGIFGDYLTGTFSIPFDVSGTMSLTCTKILSKM